METKYDSRTPEREVWGSILTRVAELHPWARYIYLPKSTGNTQKAVAPSRYDWKFVEWDIKPQPKQKTKKYDRQNWPQTGNSPILYII